MAETILQNWVVIEFILPFLLIFFISYGVLMKTKVLGDKNQLNALVAFVIGLIFVGAIFPKLVVGNMVLFLTVALTTMFVALLLWGFVAGEDGLKFGDFKPGVKIAIAIVVVVAVVGALLWALGATQANFQSLTDFIFKSSWSKDFWTNAAFIAVVIIALATMLKGK